MGARVRPAVFVLIGGAFGLAAARGLLDAWPWLAGPFPRLALALAAALASGLAGYRLHRTALPTPACLPLLLPAAALLSPAVNPLRDGVLILGGLALAFAGARRAGAAPHPLYPLSLALIAGLLYLRTLAPTVGEADTFEFQVNILRLGISHGSGYPLYILLARLFSLLPVGGTAAFRINLSSAFFGATSALAAYALSRTLGASRLAAWIAGLGLAVSIGLWSRAVEAEVYTLHVTLVGVLLLLALQDTGKWVLVIGHWRIEFRRWELLAFLSGLSLTNHLTTALLAPAIGLAILLNLKSIQAEPKFHSITNYLLLITLFIFGLSVYLYLPLRWPAVNQGEVMTWDMFRHFLTGREAQGALRLDAWIADPGRYAIVGRKVLDQFGWPGAAAALVGLVALARRRPGPAAVTLLAYGAYVFFGLSFYVPDPDYSSFLLPAHLVQAAWMAAGIQAMAAAARYAAAKVPGWVSAQSLRVVLYSAFFCLPASLLWRNLPLVDQSNDWREYRLGQYILSRPLEPGAAILADSELIAPLYYLQVAEGLRPDLDIVVLPDEAAYRAELDARVSNGQTVYLGRYLPHLAEVYYLRSAGPLTEARLEPGALPAALSPVEKDFGDVIRLHGFNLESASAAADGTLHLTLYWQALAPSPASHLVRLRLVDSAGHPALDAPPQVPVGQMYNTTAWPANDVIADFHAVALDPALAPGVYRLQVGLFPPFSSEGLPAAPGEPWLTLSEVTIVPPEGTPVIANPVRMRFGGGTWLVGYDAPPAAAPGSSVQVTLYWRSAAGVRAALCAGERCVPIQVRGGDTITRAAVPTPGDARDLDLRVGVAGLNAECAWWAPWGEACRLSRIRLEGTALAPEAINFDNQIVLESFTLETTEAAPGGLVSVLTRWRGLRPMDQDYTVFVHLLGPDGIVHGQEDRWPVQGTQPTSQWPVNQTLVDRFEVRVPDDAPPGAYTVEVGWYLLATLDRLPVVDAQGVAIDDRYLVSGLEIR